MVRAQSLPVYVGIGLAGGFFSALFGVGGGIVVVPLLVVFTAFSGHEATATSLAVIGFTAVVGAATYGLLGDVHLGYAVLIALPAVAGVIVGTWLQQRVASRTLILLFATFLVLVAVRLFTE